MQYLSPADILAIHDRVIEETGGALGVRDTGLLKSIAHRPQASFGNVEQFPDVFIKAAVYMESIATYHVFLDGNKRTALSVAAIFLALNGYVTTFPIDATEKFVIAVAQRQKNLEEITAWLKERSQKTKATHKIPRESNR